MVGINRTPEPERSASAYAHHGGGPSIWDNNPLGTLMGLSFVASIPIAVGIHVYETAQARSHAQAVYRQTAMDQTQLDNVRSFSRGTFTIKLADGRQVRAEIRYTDSDAAARQVMRRNHHPLPAAATRVAIDTSNRVVRYNDGNTVRTDPLPPNFTENPQSLREQVGAVAGRTAVHVGRGVARGAMDSLLGRDKP